MHMLYIWGVNSQRISELAKRPRPGHKPPPAPVRQRPVRSHPTRPAERRHPDVRVADRLAGPERAKLEQIGESCSMIYLFVRMKGEPAALGLRGANIWHWPDRDYHEMLERYYADPLHAPMRAPPGTRPALDTGGAGGLEVP